MYAGRTESAHSAEMKGKYLNMHNFAQQLQDGCHAHMCRIYIKIYFDKRKKTTSDGMVPVEN